MDKLFNPDSIVIVGLSSKSSNIPKLVLENLIRWGYKGRIFGVNPTSRDEHVDGIKMYRAIEELPIVPDLAFTLVPAKYVPDIMAQCGKFGIKRMAIPSGGFNEFGDEGKNIAETVMNTAREYGIRFVGPNGVTVANTNNGLCLPFVPSYSPPKGGLSIITQSGGVGLMLWNLMTDENIGMAKFASIGNKLDMDEVDFLEYFGGDPETTIIGMYLESIPRGERFIKAAANVGKPVIVLKSNTTEAGKKAAMSHTAALSNDERIIDAAFDRAGIIRIGSFTEFISVSQAFQLPPLRGKRLMVMSPAGGFTVMMADYCEKLGFQFADPGREFYEGLKKFSNAGVINFSNPLDMGDIYDTDMYAHIFYTVMHNENVDGAVYVSQWPHMPRGEDVFYKMFHTDLSTEATGTMLSSGKPIGACLFGLSSTISSIKQNINFPLFNSTEEMLCALWKQYRYHNERIKALSEYPSPQGIDMRSSDRWIVEHPGVTGEDSLELLKSYGIGVPRWSIAGTAEEAVSQAREIGYPVVMKVVSPDAVHKSEAGGVLVGIGGDDEAADAFGTIRENLMKYREGGEFVGVRVMAMAPKGHDMFIGGVHDRSFGPVVFFGYGGIFVEVFRDVETVFCPESRAVIERKLENLKSFAILKGTRGGGRGDIGGYVEIIERVTHLMANHRSIAELDLNPVRVLSDGSGVVALDARIRIE